MQVIITIPKENFGRTTYYCSEKKKIPITYVKKEATKFDISEYERIVSTMYSLSLVFEVSIKLKVLNE